VDDERRIAEIEAWFREEGFELVVHPVRHGGYFAPYMRIGRKGGNAPFTWGETALEAAEAAKAQYERSTNNAAAAEAFRQALDRGGGLWGDREPEEPQHGLGLEHDVSRRDDPW
jgi:hypothetical protein